MSSSDPASLLVAERDRLVAHLSRLRADFAGIVAASAQSNADDEHDPEGATIAFERSQVGAFIAQAEQHLAEVDRAMGRVTDGSYGSCVGCGGRIPAARLQARPTAQTCIACAR